MQDYPALFPISISELIAQVKQAVREELAASVNVPATTTSAELPISQKELCQHLGISQQTAIRWKKRKKIPVIQNGSTVRYVLSEVLKALGK